MEGTQLVRVGFINREFRLFAQIRTSRGIFELIDSSVLTEGFHQIVVTFGDSQMTLYVDSDKVKSTPMEGQFECKLHESVAFGHGGGGGIAT